jgi:uncharacterized damage-inducible protein DinB
MDKNTLLAAMEFSRGRLLGVLDTIEKSGQDLNKVLVWRPGPGRAHIAWQAMHCAATHDKYLNVGLQGKQPKDEALVANYGGGSKPADAGQPNLGVIRDKLASTYEAFKAFVASQTPEGLDRQVPAPGGKTRSVAEAITLLTWHEAHHQGQIHLTWNLYKAANGVA